MLIDSASDILWNDVMCLSTDGDNLVSHPNGLVAKSNQMLPRGPLCVLCSHRTLAIIFGGFSISSMEMPSKCVLAYACLFSLSSLNIGLEGEWQ